VLRLYLVPVGGGMPEPLPVPRVGHATFDGAAKRIAYTPFRDAFRTWKRYRGGRTTPLWVYDRATHAVEVVPHVNASDTFPCWIGEDVYFASDRPGADGVVQMNVWRYRPGGEEGAGQDAKGGQDGQVEQITRFVDFGVQSMSAGAGVLVFSLAGSLRTYDPATKRFQ
jgi:tricorn protease